MEEEIKCRQKLRYHLSYLAGDTSSIDLIRQKMNAQ